MIKCANCKVNAAVIFITRFESGSRLNEGLCLKCARKTGIGQMDSFFTQAGITEENIDNMTANMNRVMEKLGDRDPAEFLREITASGNLESLMEGMAEDSDEAIPDDGDRDGSEAREGKPRQSGFMLPAATGREPGDTPANERETGDRPAREPGDVRPDDGSPKRTKRKFLDQFGANLTSRARIGRIDRVIGRAPELQRVIQILNRRNKNNPVLLGEPGVGKTAIAEGLAVKIAAGEVPSKLLRQEVYLLDMTAMVAGTQFRGQFESRMKGVVDEARAAGNIILVIDELHNIMGAGDAEGAMNAANILKPTLAKGEIRVLGSTTLDEYRRFIEKDSALERRFQPVIVNEPSIEDTIEILKGIKDYYEKHHHVTYSDNVIKAAVRLSERYITERFLPDKAIDLLDEAGSRANLADDRLTRFESMKQELEGAKAEQSALEVQIEKAAEATATEGAPKETQDLAFYERQAEVKSHILRLEEDLASLENELSPTPITEEDIARVVEMWTGIPAMRITEAESEKLMHLEERLHKRVIGQLEAVSSISRAIRRNRAGFGKKRKPASFLFVGPTGVGKTELVKALAEALFENEEALIRLDMSEFMEPHTVSKLIGSPPGYVGYDDGGQLTEKIRRKPYSVVLLDEIEKAHADVFNILLQILDDGRLTDSHGRVVSFENAVIVMTSNAGTTLKANGIGFGATGHVAMESRVQTVLKDMFRPEFLNRIDETIVFHELEKSEIRRIVDLMLTEVKLHLAEKGLALEVTEPAKDLLAEKGYDPKYGARPLRKTIQRLVEDPLADMLLTGKFVGFGIVRVGVDESGATLTFETVLQPAVETDPAA
jgi:ATP-dependent Clp protease ATP-binding subunit ClpE